VDIMLVLVVLLVVVLIWRGPTMLPRLGEAMGKTVKGVRENLPGAMDDEADPGSKTDSNAKSGS
jgi:Sec-independent protein translocase protein TatA